MEKIGVIGAGTMGSGIAQVFARAGFKVWLNDINKSFLEKADKKIENNLDYLISRKKISGDEKNEIYKRIKFTEELTDLADAELIIEAVVEDMAVKKELFQKLDSLCKKETIFATNTSALSITEIAACLQRKDKVLGIHFFNPAAVMKLVELVRAASSSEETFVKVRELLADTDKEIVVVEESPGFIVNRLLILMINEAIYLLSEGIATKEDIDKALKLGANHPLGPLALADLIGLDICLAIMETLYQEFKDCKYRPCPLLRKKVRSGELGKKCGQGFYSY